jgi:hypothetical protein
MKCMEYDDAPSLTIKIKEKTLGRINDALAVGVLPCRTPVGFAVAAILWALDSFEEESQSTMMGLTDEE